MARKKTPKQTELPLAVTPAGKLPLEGTYRDYFLQYASYVITDRAIPDLADGCKPVQRRLLQALWDMEDGRYHKVANVIGHTMMYHPHGDASIGAALVGMGQWDLLIDAQGNWGDPRTGDAAAAPRYIEARLARFAQETLFAPHLTEFKKSYDGRRKEPVALPARFPLLLLLGAEGIAVGLSTKMLPHNFVEICEAVKSYLRQEPFELFPDFPTGGLADVSAYGDGRPGSRVKVRARLEKGDGKTIIIREIPYGATTASLIDSILAASDKGKIKLARVEDNTAAEVEIHVVFQRGVEMDKAIDALYAFTECEVTHSPNGMVIVDGKPETMGAMEMVAYAADRTKALLKRDLEHQLAELEQRWHHKSLVQIFVENRIYLRIEKSQTWESVLSEIDQGLAPFKKQLRRPVVEADLVMLTEVKMRRISAWDAERAREELTAIDAEIRKVKKQLKNMVQYTIDWCDHLLQAYGKGRTRKTELASFDAIKAVEVVERTEKLYVDREGGFIGVDLKNAEELGPCSLLDDALVIREDGGMQVVRIGQKVYVGEKIVHAQLFAPEDRDAVFNLIYEDALTGKAWVKRFPIGGVTREKVYELCRNAKKPRVLFCEPGAEKTVFIKLRKKPRIRTDRWFDFGSQLVKGRDAGGNSLSKHRISSVRAVSREQYEKHAVANGADDAATNDLGAVEGAPNGKSTD
jgi:topoisomerase-4 subunit A